VDQSSLNFNNLMTAILQLISTLPLLLIVGLVPLENKHRKDNEVKVSSTTEDSLRSEGEEVDADGSETFAFTVDLTIPFSDGEPCENGASSSEEIERFVKGNFA